jgi:serine/threonine protein kinase/tetratricopeptide (TPR) repeat protein
VKCVKVRAVDGCPDEDDVAAFARGELETSRAADVERHLDGCPSCARVVTELVRIFSTAHFGADGDRSGDAKSSASPGPSMEMTETEQSTHSSLEEDVPALPAGAQVGRYKVLECIGIGGMGVVYGAYDPELDRKVALKLLRRGVAGDQERRNARLRREAQAMAKIADPNVITVHDVGLFEGRVFIAMEFVEGTTLTKWMRETPRPFKDVRNVFSAAGAGLAAAHRAGLVHRDFKPDNVLIGHDGRVRVTDFGLASFRDGVNLEDTDGPSTEHSDPVTASGPIVATLTKTGALVGTPAYMSPEAYRGRRVTAASDQFSFCVAMYEALYGERPFDGRTLAELATNVTSGSVRILRDSNVPVRVRELIMRGLSVDPAQRFPSMQALLVVLNRRPSRTARRWAMVVVPLTLLLAGLWWDSPGATAGVPFCRPELGMDAVWSPERTSKVRAAFEATAVPWAENTADAIVQQLDDWTARWNAERQIVCAAGATVSALPRQEALASHCLTRQRVRADALVEVFEAADAQTLDRALGAVDALPDPSSCRDDHSLDANVVPPPTAQVQDLVAEFREQLERAFAKASAGRHEDALALAIEVDEAAAGLEYPPLRAEAHLHVGRYQAKLGKLQKARATLEEAAWLGVESHHRKVTAQAWIELVFVNAVELGDFAAGHRALRAAEAEVGALGDDPTLRDKLLVHGATLAIAEGRHEDAMESLQKVLSHYVDGDVTMERVDLLFNIAGIEAETGRYEAAEEHYREYIAAHEERYGSMHPDVAAGHFNLATVLYRQKRSAEALVEFRLAGAIEDVAVAPDHPRRADTQGAIGQTLVALQRPEEAVPYFEEAVRLATHDGGSRGQAAHHRMGLAEVLIALGRLDDASAVLRRADEDLASLGGDDHVDRPRWHEVRSSLAKAQGDLKTARTHAQTALDLERRKPELDVPAIAHRELDLAEIEAQAGDERRARELAESALQTATDAASKARARGVLAKLSTGTGTGTEELGP